MISSIIRCTHYIYKPQNRILDMDTENPTPSKESNTQPHQKTKQKKMKYWDVLIKEAFDQWGKFEHYSDFKVGKLPLEIDYIIRLTAEQKEKNLIPIFKEYMKQWNVFEFKLSHDTDKITDFWKVFGYTYLFLEKKEFKPELKPDICAWYICSAPPKLFTFLKNDLKLMSPGLYQLSFQFPFYLLIIEELPIAKENVVLKLFTTDTQLPMVWEMILNEKLSKDFLSVSYLLYPEELEKFMRGKGLSMEELGIRIQKAIQKVGLKNVIEEIGLKAVIEQIGWEELIGMISDPKELQALKKILEKKEKQLLQRA